MATEQTESDLGEIELENQSTKAAIVPSRGGMLTRLEVSGRSLLYLDRATLVDPTQNVRGGAPVLFPTPGKLSGDAWRRGDRSGTLKQHGFARNLKWSVKAKALHVSVTLGIESTAETRRNFPWDFAVDLVYSVTKNAVRIEQRIENRSPTVMPFGFGFHPYFIVDDARKSQARVPTAAKRAFDNTVKREVDVPASGIDLTAKEVDLHLIDHGRRSAELQLADGYGARITASEEYGRWVVWTLAGKDFVCVEPWTCPGDALNTGAQLIELAPGETRTLWVEIGSID